MTPLFKTSPDSQLCAVHRVARNVATLRAAFTLRSVKLLALGLGLAAVSLSSARANTEFDVPNGTADLTTLAVTSANDLTFTNTAYAPATFTLGSVAASGTAATAALTVGTLDDLDATQTLVINPSVGNAGTATITLSGGTNVVAPNAADLLYVASGGTLTINALNGTAATNGTLNMVLGASGNFDVAGTSTVSAVISGTGFGITKTGAGTLTLSGLNTYTGGTTASAGTLLFGGTGTTTSGAAGTGTLTLNGGSIGAVSTGGGIANAVAVSTATQIGGTGQGTLTLILGSTLTGSGNLTLASNFVVQGGNNTTFNGSGYTGTLTVNSGVTLTEQNTAALKTNNLNLSNASVVLNGTINYGAGGSNGSANGTFQIGALSGSGTIGAQTQGGTGKAVFLTLGSSTLANSTFSGTITQVNDTTTVTKVGTNTLTLTGTNTYTGNTNIQNGSVSVSAIGNSGSNGNVGAGTTITFGAGTTTGTLVYTGTGETTSKIVSLSSTGTGGGVIDQSGTGALVFSAFATPAAASHTLTLQGSTAGTGEISAAIVDNSATNKTSVTKAGTGTWTLSGANTYTGATTVNSGILSLVGSLANTSAVTVGNGGTFGANGAINTAALVTVNAGGILRGNGGTLGAITMTGATFRPGENTSGVNYATPTQNSPASSAGFSGVSLTATSLTLDVNSTYVLNLGAATAFTASGGGILGQSSLLTLSGNLTLGGSSLTVNDSNATGLVAGEVFKFIQYGGTLSGTFAQGNTVTGASGTTYSVNYAAGDPFVELTVLSVVPEPGTWAMVGAGLACLLLVSRARRCGAMR